MSDSEYDNDSDNNCNEDATLTISEIFDEEKDITCDPEDNIFSSRYVKNNEGTKRSTEPWVEKYRPKKLDDIIEQDEIVKILKNTLETGELPHMLFFGPPGTGKTSTILAIAMQLFGPRIIDDRVIELNASDDRGIGTVRNTIITFAKISIGSKDPKYPCPDFKIIILDEADAMTPEAQAALRKVMEKMSGITRFCFICNYINQIIDPISSRCMKFRFKPINKLDIINKLKSISQLEKIKVNDKCLNTIVDMSDGDVRRSIMSLQNLKYIINYKKNVTSDDIVHLSGGIKKNQFKNFWNNCTTGTVSTVRKLTLMLKRNGYPVKSILNYIKECLLESKLNDTQISIISIELCQTDRRLMEGANEYIQLLNILLYINKIAKMSV
jgi:replication factor C subunit 2/4